MSISILWKRYFWGSRRRHPDIDEIFRGSTKGGFVLRNGIYFIGCGYRIIYIGASYDIPQRSIVSLARFYHKIDDITLPWSIGLAPLDKNDDSNELESSAIRKFAPIFNTSIPSKLKSKGKEPKIIHIARVFADQDKNCSAFNVVNLNKQAEEAEKNPTPPWKQGHKRRRVWDPITHQLVLRDKYKEEKNDK